MIHSTVTQSRTVVSTVYQSKSVVSTVYQSKSAVPSNPTKKPAVPLLHPHFFFAVLWIFCCATESQAQSNSATSIQFKVERGITGTRHFNYSGKPLKAKPQRDSDAAIVLRLSESSNDFKSYEAKFLGNREGNYDLRELVEHADGTEVVDLPPFLVEIVSMLPKDQRSDLFEAARFDPKVWGGYRLSICLLGLIWICIPVIVFVNKLMQPKPIVVPPFVEPKPTFADQLKPLVEAAAAGTLSVREKGRLELLLLHYWRERLALHGVDMATAIGQLRSHPEAGRLVTTVERWLHKSETSAGNEDCSPDAIMKLLGPYRGELASGGGHPEMRSTSMQSTSRSAES